MPQDITAILNSLLQKDAKNAYNDIVELKTTKGLALEDILREIHKYVLRFDTKKNELVLIDLIDNMAEIEKNLTTAASEKLQLGGNLMLFDCLTV